MTPPDDDPPPQPPKRRRKPPKGFDTGYPEDAVEDVESGGIQSKPIWTEPVAAPPPQKIIVDPSLAAPSDTPRRHGDTPIGAPLDTPLDRPMGAPLDTPIGAPLDRPTGAPLDTPLDRPMGAPLDTPIGAPLDTPIGAPLDTPLDTPIGMRHDRPRDDQLDWQLDEPIDTPLGASPDTSTGAPLPPPIEAAPLADPGRDTGRIAAAQLDSGPYERAPSQAYESSPAAQPGSFQGFEPMPVPTDQGDAIGKKKKAKNPNSEVVTLDYDDFDDAPRRSRRTVIVAATSLVVGLGIAALVFLGRQNSSWFYITCEPDRIVAQQGRAFPPWGETALGGKAWAAVKIPPDAECIPLETEDEAQLATAFRTMLVKRASALLTAKEVTKTDEANALLDQALLHARANTDAAREARAEIQRLLGDVAYWRASNKMREASKSLVDAAKQFEAAAQQRPRHVTDASAWAEYVRKVVGELEAGPNGVVAPILPPMPSAPGEEPRPPAPPGVALPVEPDQGSASEAPPPTPDAGVQGGGVLL